MAAGRGLRAMAWAWLLAGALSAGFGTLMLAGAGLFVANSAVTVGEVDDHHGAIAGSGPRKRGRSDPKRVAVVEYRDGGGGVHRVVGNVARTDADLPALGTRVPVRYQRLADGTMAQRIDSGMEVWAIPAAFTLFGVAFLGAGVAGRRAAARGARVEHGPAVPRGLHRDPEAAARVLAKLRRPRR